MKSRNKFATCRGVDEYDYEDKYSGEFKTFKSKQWTDKNGNDRFIYWDFDAENKTGGLGDWRQAVGQWTIKAIA